MAGALLPDPFLGKIILYQETQGRCTLALKSSIDQECWIDAQRGRSPAGILTALRVIPESKGYDENFGFHREIPHRGEVHGGGIALFLEGIFYLDCQSQAYGALERERVVSILSRPEVRPVSGALIEIVAAADGKGTPFPYYLGKELR